MTTIGLPTLRAAELAIEDTSPRWLISELWAASGVGFIGGNPKSCKSWLGLEVAVSVSSGTNCLDRFPVILPGPSLIYLAEDALHIVRERLLSLCVHHRVDIGSLDLHVITAPRVRLDHDEHVSLLEATIQSLRPRLLLLDPFVRLHSIDENNAQEVARILQKLREFERRYHLAVILVHHTRKAGSGTTHGLALRGSGDFWAWGDSNLYLTRVKQGLHLVIEHRAASAPEPLTLVLDGSPPHLCIMPSSNDKTETLDTRIIDTLQREARPITRHELRGKLSVNNARLGATLQLLEQKGRIAHTSTGWQVCGV